MKKLGDFVQEKRKERNLTIRKLASLMEVNPAYIKDTEEGFTKLLTKQDLDKMAEVMNFTTKERHEMYDLAANGGLPEDITEYLLNNEDVKKFIRITMDGYPAKKELCRRFIKNLSKMSKKQAEKVLSAQAQKDNEKSSAVRNAS